MKKGRLILVKMYRGKKLTFYPFIVSQIRVVYFTAEVCFTWEKNTGKIEIKPNPLPAYNISLIKLAIIFFTAGQVT